MRLYLIQHGEAIPEEKDPERPLSENGKTQTKKIAQFLKSKAIKADSVWHSKKLRAIQTAKIISKALNIKTVERNNLNPLDPPDILQQEILKLNKDLVIIGHLPFLQKLASLLLTGAQDLELVSFTYSGVVCLEYQESWKIAWFVRPEMV